MELTRDHVRRVWAHLARRYGTVTVPKARSPLMRAAGLALHAGGVLDRRRFMEGFTTVIGRRIYAPFDPGGGEMSPFALLDTCIHEHQHVVQLERDGRPRFWGRYLASTRARALYEAEAYTCGLELAWFAGRPMPDPRRVADVLRDYGCSEADRDAAAEVLARHAARIRAGRWVTEAFRAALEVLEA